MSPRETEWNEPWVKLLPHQAELVETVFSPSSKRIVLLKASAGLGKGVALVAVARRLLQERPNARALFLVPSALRYQFAKMLDDASVPSLLVDRYVFREMLDSAVGQDIWPTGKATVLSIDFAKQPDILDSLVRCHWDILFVDEWHLAGRLRARAFRRIETSANRLVLASATSQNAGVSDVFMPKDMTVVEWRRDQIVDLEGKQLLAAPPRAVHEISYTLDEMELSLRRTVIELCKLLGGSAVIKAFQRKTYIRLLESSPAAIEGALQRLVDRVALPNVPEELSDLLDETEDDDSPTGYSKIRNSEEVARVAEKALHKIEASTSDSKLKAFGELLTGIHGPNAPSRQVVVLTDFVATLFYLAADIEGRGMACQLLHGSMGFEERVRSLELSSTEGGTLVATRAVIGQGIDLRKVTDLVLYDPPLSSAAVEQVLGRFDRIGRTTQLNIHIFTSTNIPEDLLADSLGTIADSSGS